MAGLDAATVESRLDRLNRSIAGHKRAIQTHRTQLQAEAHERDELEAHAQRLGLALKRSPGAGVIHGRPDP